MTARGGRRAGRGIFRDRCGRRRVAIRGRSRDWPAVRRYGPPRGDWSARFRGQRASAVSSCWAAVVCSRLRAVLALGGGALGGRGLESGDRVAELTGRAAGPRAHRHELAAEAIDFLLDVGPPGDLRFDAGLDGGDLRARGRGLRPRFRGGCAWRLPARGRARSRAASSLASAASRSECDAFQLGELRFAGDDLPREGPPIDQADLRAEQLQAAWSIRGSGAPCRPASGRCGAGFRLRRRCRRAAADSARRARAAARRSAFLALNRLMPAASSKISRRSRGDDCRSTSTLPCSMMQ